MESPNPTSVYALEPGVVYVVTKPFVDYHRGEFNVGELLTYETHSFLPYHGGYTIFFREKAMYLQENDHADILFGMDKYLAVHDASGRKVLPRLAKSLRKEGGLLDFILSLCLFGAAVFLLFTEKRPGFMGWASAFLFGIFTIVFGIDWWNSHRKR